MAEMVTRMADLTYDTARQLLITQTKQLVTSLFY